MKIGMKGIGPMKMRQHGNPKAGMNGKNMMNTDFSKEKERKERKEKEKERKVTNLQIKEKDKVMGKEKQTMGTHRILLNPQCSKQLYLRQRVPLWFLCDTFRCMLTSVKVTKDEEQSMEPDFSGCAFLVIWFLFRRWKRKV